MIIKDIILERILGRPARRSLPNLDGAWRPNDALDHSVVHADGIEGPTGLAVGGDGILYAASGCRVLALDGVAGAPETVATYDGCVQGLAWHHSTGLVAGITGIGVAVGIGASDRPEGGTILCDADSGALRYPTAVMVAPDGAIVVSEGARDVAAADWVRDLMAKGRSGRVLRFAPGETRAVTLADALAFPTGLACDADGGIVVCEAWDYRILGLTASGGKVLCADLAGYPGGLLRVESGWYLSLFAPRSHIVEFVLEEDGFRQRMTETIEPEYWIAPTTDPREHPFIPAQVGGLRSQNIKKPWAPPRSYGLVARLDEDFVAMRSWHSRANGVRHGIDALVSRDGHVLAASRGAHCILDLTSEGGGA